MGDAVWVHSYNSTSQEVEEIQRISAPTGANPRHLAAHPLGKFVFVLYEELSELAIYSRDEDTGMLGNTNVTYFLLPSGTTELLHPLHSCADPFPPKTAFTNTSSYWADEVKLTVPSSSSGNSSTSSSPKYLITGTRSRTTSAAGYVSAFALDSATGNITSQLFLLPTTGSGGSANAVSPASFSEDYFAITDSSDNFIEVWKIEETSSNNQTSTTTASVAAHLDLDNGPANVVWYS